MRGEEGDGEVQKWEGSASQTTRFSLCIEQVISAILTAARRRKSTTFHPLKPSLYVHRSSRLTLNHPRHRLVQALRLQRQQLIAPLALLHIVAPVPIHKVYHADQVREHTHIKLALRHPRQRGPLHGLPVHARDRPLLARGLLARGENAVLRHSEGRHVQVPVGGLLRRAQGVADGAPDLRQVGGRPLGGAVVEDGRRVGGDVEAEEADFEAPGAFRWVSPLSFFQRTSVREIEEKTQKRPKPYQSKNAPVMKADHVSPADSCSRR